MLTDKQIHQNWLTLMHMVRNVCPEFIPVMHQWSQDCSSTDSSGNKIVYPGFENAPAGKGIHHQYKGGLVEHLTEMLAHSERIAAQFGVNQYSLAVVIMIHDLHKAYKCYKYVDNGFDYAQHATNDQMTNNMKSLWMLFNTPNLNASELLSNYEVLNAFESSEGGYARNAPKEQSMLAKAAYICDELSVLQNRRLQGRFISVRDRENQPDYFA